MPSRTRTLDPFARFQPAREEFGFRQENPLSVHFRAKRLQLGLTQKELATKTHTSHTNISRIESGHFNPSVETLIRLCEALHEDLTIAFQDQDAPGSDIIEFFPGPLQVRPARPFLR